MSLAQSLETLVKVIELRGIAVRQRLNPGIVPSDVDATFASLGIPPPTALSELYMWHDGIDDEYFQLPVGLFGEYQFLDLDQAIKEYHAINTYYDQGSLSISLTQCFPFASFQGDYCAIYCDTSPINGLIHPIINVYDSITVMFESLDHMVRTATAWIEEGVYDNSPVDELQKQTILNRINNYLFTHTISLE